MSIDTILYASNEIPEIIITYSSQIPPEKCIQIRSSKQVAEVFRHIWKPDMMEYKEQFYVLCLSRSNHIIGYFLHSSGGLSGTVVDAKQILAAAIKANAASIILCHNHPSNNTTPSTADKVITHKITEGAGFLNLKVLDHLIITRFAYFSFADEGILPQYNTDDNSKITESTYAILPKSMKD